MDDDSEQILSEEQFWEELDDVVSTPCRSNDRIDDTLRTWIGLITRHREEHINHEEDLGRCAGTLLTGSVFSTHAKYVRRQLVYALLQDDDPITLHVVTSFLLSDGLRHDDCFELLAAEGGFGRLVNLAQRGVDDEAGLHRQLLVLLYEMSRIQRIAWNELVTVDDAFILYLFGIIESLSSDVTDPYHSPVMRVLLVLNEQYMVSGNPSSPVASQAMTNRVIKVLSTHGRAYKTFGENIILLLNRESETSLQLLILKLFYLLFTTASTYEYFYTNDLHVLVDILIRNLLDLPPDSITTPTTSSLRHTYLRVLHPLLAHTQLSTPPHYKRDELRKMLFVLVEAGHTHFERPDETTIRLVGRCLRVEWLRDHGDDTVDVLRELQALVEEPVTAGHAVVAKKLLGISLPEAQESALSVNEVAKQQAKPGEATPSRRLENGVDRHSSDERVESASESNPFED